MGAIEKPLAGIIGDIHAFHDELRQIRQDIHAHPETAFDEQRTSEIVATKLKEWGSKCIAVSPKTGVVGVLRNGTSSRKIGLRADMDALHIHEKNAFAHKSTNEGKMHACGHDGHTTMLLGAARHLASTRNFDGTVNFIFQPAEENEGGARAMIEEGLFDALSVRHRLGNAQLAGAPARTVLRDARSDDGVASTSSRSRVTGRGAHAAMPHNGRDPIVAGSALCRRCRRSCRATRIRSRRASSASRSSMAATRGTSSRTKWCLRGTARAFKTGVQDLIERRIARNLRRHRRHLRLHGQVLVRPPLSADHQQRCRGRGRRARCWSIWSAADNVNTEANADDGLGGLRGDAAGEAGLLHLDRQRRGRARLPAAQPGLRLQRRDPAAGRELLGEAGGADCWRRR